MLESTFQLVRGMGPKRERALWQAGIHHWSELPAAQAPTELVAAVADAQAALAAQDADRLAAALPSGEHWRLFPLLADETAYLDIETSDDVVGYNGISAIGFLDARGPRLLLAGGELRHFPELAARWPLLVTFNGLSFDVPHLRAAFPDWQPPRAHADLRHLLARLGHHGGLKAIERALGRLGLARPAHLDGLDGSDTGWLFRRGREGDLASLRRFAEYNLYDAINLRTLMGYAYNQLLAEASSHAPGLRALHSPMPVWERGDVLYDVSKILLGLRCKRPAAPAQSWMSDEFV